MQILLSYKFSSHCDHANRKSNLLEDENAAVDEMTQSRKSAHFPPERCFLKFVFLLFFSAFSQIKISLLSIAISTILSMQYFYLVVSLFS